MSESDPSVECALYLHHVEAGIEVLEAQVLDHQDREFAGRLAWRLLRLAYRVEEKA